MTTAKIRVVRYGNQLVVDGISECIEAGGVGGGHDMKVQRRRFASRASEE